MLCTTRANAVGPFAAKGEALPSLSPGDPFVRQPVPHRRDRNFERINAAGRKPSLRRSDSYQPCTAITFRVVAPLYPLPYPGLNLRGAACAALAGRNSTWTMLRLARIYPGAHPGGQAH